VRGRIDQALAGMHDGDAITHDALAMRMLLRSLGFQSDIYADPAHIGPEMRSEAIDFRRHEAQSDSIVIYHCAIDSPLTSWYRALTCRRVMRYHNITPAEHFVGFNERTAAQLAQGRRMLPSLAEPTELAICDSAYNASELDAMGFRHTEVLPIVIDFASFDERPDPKRLRELAEAKGKRILFVGRIAPNKRQCDLIRLQALRRRVSRVPAQLYLVGSFGGAPRYMDHLMALRRHLGVEDIVHFTGMVSHADLLAFFKTADLFVCLSEHEGFCVPLVEAMHFGIPIIAHAAGAVPETLGDSGILVQQKTLPALAELVDVALTDEDLRERTVAKQRARLAAFEPERVKRRFLELLETFQSA